MNFFDATQQAPSSRRRLAVAGILAGLVAGCGSSLKLVIGKERMDKPGVLYCDAPPNDWVRQGWPHINATVDADCDSEGDLDVSVLTPAESRVKGKVSAKLETGKITQFKTPSFPKPKSKRADVMLRVGGVCGGKYVSTVATCEMPW